MLITLPLMLFIVMAELSIGAFGVLFLLDWRNMVKRNFLVTYAIIYVLFTGLTVLFQLNFSNQELLNTFTLLDKSWTAYLTPFLLLFLVLMVPYTILLIMDKKAGVDGKFKQEEEEIGKTRWSNRRIARHIVGSLDVLAGIAVLFVLGMIFRPLAAAGPAEAFAVGSFFASALALGGVMTAMWLGHWYLVTPALSEKPLRFATTLVLIGILAQLVFTFTGGLSTVSQSQSNNAVTPTVTATSTTSISPATPVPNSQVKPADALVVAPLSIDVIGWLRLIVAFLLPLALLGFILKLIHDRSFQSATGMLYLVVVLTLAGEALSRGLFLAGLS
jgi:DMSO reductase anchor subunit